MDKNLETIGKLLEKDRLIAMGKIDEEGLPSTEDINEVKKAFNCQKRAWIAMSKIPAPIEERIWRLRRL